MKTCDTCQHWILGNNTVRQCSKLTENADTRLQFGESQFHIYIDQMANCDVYTGPKFGCVKHQRK